MDRLQDRETVRAEKGRKAEIPSLPSDQGDVQFRDAEKEGAEEDFVGKEKS